MNLEFLVIIVFPYDTRKEKPGKRVDKASTMSYILDETNPKKLKNHNMKLGLSLLALALFISSFVALALESKLSPYLLLAAAVSMAISIGSSKIKRNSQTK